VVIRQPNKTTSLSTLKLNASPKNKQVVPIPDGQQCKIFRAYCSAIYACAISMHMLREHDSVRVTNKQGELLECGMRHRSSRGVSSHSFADD
jgi:hypothetical protein